jgi:hypothetical protein
MLKLQEANIHTFCEIRTRGPTNHKAADLMPPGSACFMAYTRRYCIADLFCIINFEGLNYMLADPSVRAV